MVERLGTSASLELHGTNQDDSGSRQVPKSYRQYLPLSALNRMRGIFQKQEIDSLVIEVKTYEI